MTEPVDVELTFDDEEDAPDEVFDGDAAVVDDEGNPDAPEPESGGPGGVVPEDAPDEPAEDELDVNQVDDRNEEEQ